MTVSTDIDLDSNPGLSLGEVARPLNRVVMVLAAGLIGIVVWSLTAPLATSIQVQGFLRSAAPSYEIQHPFGGPIASVHVAELDQVTEGQILMRIDMSDSQAQRTQTVDQLTLLEAENTIIEELLTALEAGATAGPNNLELLTASPGPVARRYQQVFVRNMQEQETARQITVTAQKQSTLLETQIAWQRDRLASMTQRFTRLESLNKKGLLKLSDFDTLGEAILMTQSDIANFQARLSEARTQLQTGQREVLLRRSEFLETLLETRLANLKRMPVLRRELTQASRRIERAEIRSPTDGVVSGLVNDTGRSFAAQGQTLMTISEPISNASVDFTISPSVADQVYIGMRGQLTITSLARAMSRPIQVEIVSLAPIAERDQENNPHRYRGRAQILPEDKHLLEELSRDGARLVSDLTVSISLSGREMTFFDFLIKPFVDGLKLALQD